MLRDHNWYNANSQRPWPLDDSATLQADDGQLIPQNLLTDLQLRFPRVYGQRAYLGSLYFGPAAVAVLILSDSGQLLAAFNGTRQGNDPLRPGRIYQLQALAEGVGGWLVFGQGLLDQTALRLVFSTAAQSRLLPAVARSYSSPPVISAGRLAADTELQGIVKLTAGPDLEIVAETLEIDGQDRQAIVFNLTRDDSAADRNVLAEYAGDCGKRPESRSCGDPEPIEFINTVQPDCCGNIFLEFRGCASISEVFANESALLIDCQVLLADACVTPQRLPDASGKLPNEYTDNCDPDAVTTTTTTTEPPDPPIFFTRSSSGVSLPWTDDFDDFDATAFQTVSGGFSLVPDGQQDGRSLAGEIDIVIPNSGDTNSTVVFAAEHGLAATETFIILSNAVSGYNALHTVEEVDDHNMLVSDVLYTSDGDGGVWLRDSGGADLNAGGSWAGGVVSVTQAPSPNDTKVRVTFASAHNLAVSDQFTLAGSTVGAYNTTHTVDEVVSATVVRTDADYTSDGAGGGYVLVSAGGGGEVASITGDPSSGYMLVETVQAHGLAIGDQLLLAGNDQAAANVKHTVFSVPSSTTFISDQAYTEDASGGLWFLASGVTDSFAYESDSLDRNIALWTYGVPADEDWRSWFIEVETVLTLRSRTIGSRHNGGLVLNYRDNLAGDGQDYWLAEINWDSTKVIRLWAVRSGAFTLLGSRAIPSLSLDKRYQLTANIVQYAPESTSAYITVRLKGLDDALVSQLGPLRAASYSPETGRVGMSSNQSTTRFDTFTVRETT